MLLLIDVSNPIWYPERSDSKRSSITSSALSHTMTSMLSLFKCIKHSSSICLEETKLVAVVNWTFDVSGSWRSFIISFFVVLLTYFYFCHHYFHISCNRCSKNYLILLAGNNLLAQRGSQYFLFSIFYCFILFFSLEQFLMLLNILSSSDYFCTFNLLYFYSPKYTLLAYFDSLKSFIGFVLKRFIIWSLTQPRVFLQSQEYS